MAKNGEDALQLIEDYRLRGLFFRFILMDFEMGSGLNGAQTIQQLKARKLVGPETAIVAHSSQPELNTMMLHEGADFEVSKGSRQVDYISIFQDHLGILGYDDIQINW